MNGGDHTTDNDSQTRDTQSGHQPLQCGEEAAATEEVVQRATYGYRYDRHNDNILKHANGVDGDNLSAKKLHEQRSHHWRY